MIVSPMLRVVEWFAGIGGCSAALAGRASVVRAVDVSRKCLDVYRSNFSSATTIHLIESLPIEMVAKWDADMWWMSPPCQPFTRRGGGRDIDDPRAASFLAILDRLAVFRPRYLALENVPPFGKSTARELLIHALERLGYSFQETLLCPSRLGTPNRRQRYYLVASLEPNLLPWSFRCSASLKLHACLDATPDESLAMPERFLEKHRYAIHVVDPRDENAVATCFTSAYGRSRVLSGSYLRSERGIRRFSPNEILRLLRFPDNFVLPERLTHRQAWPLVGNSLSIAAVRQVLSAIPELAELAELPI